jgi:hypothetical protein
MANRPGNLETFKAQLGAGARANLFNVIFAIPGGVSLPAGAPTGQPFSLLCKAATIPGKALMTIDVAFRGVKVRIAGDPNYVDWNVMFYCDPQMGAHKTILAWNETAFNSVQIAHANPTEYKGTIVVQQLDIKHDVVYEVTLLQAWPYDVQDVSFDTSAESSIIEFGATFAYERFIIGNELGG